MNTVYEGKTVFITGGSRGIGNNIKIYFQKRGANVVAPSRSELDLSSRDSIGSYLINNKELNPDIIVHCAGLNIKSEISDVSLTDVDSVFQTNYYSIVQIIKEMIPKMKKKGGKIVLITSLYSFVSKEGRLSYSSSKNALVGLCKTLSLELAPFDIMINCVAPGYVMTDMTKNNLSVDEIESIKESIPTKRFQTEEEISSIVGFLCSDENKSITGQSIAVDGGFLCR